jgi:hypothetical protein
MELAVGIVLDVQGGLWGDVVLIPRVEIPVPPHIAPISAAGSCLGTRAH